MSIKLADTSFPAVINSGIRKVTNTPVRIGRAASKLSKFHFGGARAISSTPFPRIFQFRLPAPPSFFVFLLDGCSPERADRKLFVYLYGVMRAAGGWRAEIYSRIPKQYIKLSSLGKLLNGLSEATVRRGNLLTREVSFMMHF